MQNILRNLDLQNHPFIVKEIDFITAIFNQNKALLSHSNGFNLVFYEQSESIKNEFPEKEFYLLKINILLNCTLLIQSNARVGGASRFTKSSIYSKRNRFYYYYFQSK